MTETGSSSSNSANSSTTNKGCQPSSLVSYASNLRMLITKSFLLCYESEEERESNPKGKKQRKIIGIADEEIKKEIDCFMAGKGIGKLENEEAVLKWWSDNKVNYRHINCIARKLSSAPAYQTIQRDYSQRQVIFLMKKS